MTLKYLPIPRTVNTPIPPTIRLYQPVSQAPVESCTRLTSYPAFLIGVPPIVYPAYWPTSSYLPPRIQPLSSSLLCYYFLGASTPYVPLHTYMVMALVGSVSFWFCLTRYSLFTFVIPCCSCFLFILFHSLLCVLCACFAVDTFFFGLFVSALLYYYFLWDSSVFPWVGWRCWVESLCSAFSNLCMRVEMVVRGIDAVCAVTGACGV